MRAIIKSSDFINNPKDFMKNDLTFWLYNGLDCAVTFELADTLQEEVTKRNAQLTYEFELGMCGPAMLMMTRGMRIDKKVLAEHISDLEDSLPKLKKVWDILTEEITGKIVNSNSPLQLKKLFYQYLAIEPIKKFEKGVWKVATDRDALEKIQSKYPRGGYIAKVLLRLREIEKNLNVLKSTRDEDDRIRCSYNVAGTETGRWSSSASSFRTGTNLQNITKELRDVFIPDPGKKMFYSDLDQAESRVVAYVAEDEAYIDACESGDLHTTVVKLIWPNLPWTGNLVEDRKIAELPYYRQFSYRDIAKRAGHGTNYGLQYTSLARILKIEQKTALKFQLLYLGGSISEEQLQKWHQQDTSAGFDELTAMGDRLEGMVVVAGAFPGLRRWHDKVAEQVQTKGTITTSLGRTRKFWSRPSSDATIREAIAYEPQSTIAELLNIGLYRIVRELEPKVQVLAQVHDAVLGQIDIENVEEYSGKVIDCMINPLEINGRELIIPASIDVGDNWKQVS